MTYITSLNTVRDTTGLSKLAEDRKLMPYFVTVHRTVKRILGETLYNRLITEIEADITLATEADLATLRDEHLVPFIAWETYKHAFSRLYAEFDRNGAHYKNDGNTVQADREWMKMEVASARDMADSYQRDMLTYLKNNSADGEPFEDWTTVTEDEKGERIDKNYPSGILTKRTTPRYGPWR